MISSLHHLTIATRDFAAGERAAATLFGRPAVGAAHADGVRSAWFALDNMAVRVMAPEGAGAQGDRLQARLASAGEGLWRIVFATDDLARAERTAARRGLACTRAPIAVAPDAVADSLAIDEAAGCGVAMAIASAPALRAAGPLIDGLDHVVIRTSNPDRAMAHYGARLGLDMRLDRSNPGWGARLIFFRCGDTIVEIAHMLKDGVSDAPDAHGGLSWRAHDIAAAKRAYEAAGLSVSDVRTGRREGTMVATVRTGTLGVPTILIGGVKRAFA